MAALGDDTEQKHEESILEPLEFHTNNKLKYPGSSVGRELSETACIFCDEVFYLNKQRDLYLQHLLLQHKMVIAEYTLIPNFKEYISYWRKRLQGRSAAEFCTVIKTNSLSSDPAPSEFYYLLSDILPEDKELRLKLQQQRLNEVLEQQQWEREDKSFSSSCLFCRQHFTGNRNEIFDHLGEAHNLHLGHPDNLVFKDELLELIQQKLDMLNCLYCEKVFKDRLVLKEHMRKKLHKKINPRNTTYDKFYVINYLEFGKNWEDLESEDDRDLDNESEEEVEQESELQAVCLFCSHSATLDTLFTHMKENHKFDVQELKTSLHLTFYQQVKLINYIRRQMHMHSCYVCGEKQDKNRLLEHMETSGHIGQVPDTALFDQPEYFFPTYEDDNLLCSLEDDDEENVASSPTSATTNHLVIAEDLDMTDALHRRDEIIAHFRDDP